MRRSVRVSLLLLLALTIVAWRMTKPGAKFRLRHERQPERVAPLTKSIPGASEIAGPASRVATRPSRAAPTAESRDAAALGRAVWFHVTSTEGAPIAGAIGLAAPGGAFSDPTDADGNGYLESTVVIRSARFAAPGYEPESLTVPSGTDSFEVKLRPAGMLKIRVSTSAGPPGPDTVTVSVGAEATHLYLIETRDPLFRTYGSTQAATTGVRFSKGNAVEELGANGFRITGEGKPRTFMTYRANVVRLCPLKPDLHFTIDVQHHLGGDPVRQDVQLVGAESRVVDILLPGEFGRIAGRVVGPTGDAVVRAGRARGPEGAPQGARHLRHVLRRPEDRVRSRHVVRRGDAADRVRESLRRTGRYGLRTDSNSA